MVFVIGAVKSEESQEDFNLYRRLLHNSDIKASDFI
jgi:hypothetical protein